MSDLKYIIVSDLHLNIYSKWSKPTKDVNNRFHHQRIVLRKIFQLAKKYHAGVIFDGDFFDQRSNPDCRVVNMAVQEISQGARLIPDQDIFFLAGNHDQRDNSRCPDNSLAIFRHIDVTNVFVMDRPSYVNKGNNMVYFIPYSEDKKWLQSYLDKWSKSKKFAKYHSLLCAHIGVAGSKMGSHLVRLSGEFSLKDLHHDYFDLICLGHYHLRQYLTKDHKALYVGSTIPFEHADDFQTKGVSLVNVTKGTERFIPIKSPMFFTYQIDDKDCTKSRNEIIKEAKSNYVRVISSHKDKLDYYAKHGVDTVYQSKHTYKKRLDIKPTSTAKQVVSKYIDKYHQNPRLKKVALSELGKAYSKLEKDE